MKKLLRICAVIAAAVGAGSGPMLFSLFWLFVSCDGIGTSIKDSGGSLYGGMGNPGGSGTGSGGSGFTAGDLFSLSNAGDVDAILVLLSGTGENQIADGTFTVELSADDIGLPADGTVTLTITGNGVDYRRDTVASADGRVLFEVPRIAVGTTITVTLEVKAADGSIASTGTATRLVTEGVCDFRVTMIDTAPASVPTPAPAPAPVPEGFVAVTGGTVSGAVTGSSVFKTGRTVTIRNLYVCAHEVTQEEYTAVMGSNPSSFTDSPDTGEEQSKRPVEQVSWYDTLVYCNKRSIAEGLTACYTISGSTDPDSWGSVPTSSNDAWNAADCDFDANGYRLPTEAEWEYAARGGDNGIPATQTTYSGSDDPVAVAWYSGFSSSKTHEVMKKDPNSLGIYDMSGNVEEWCWDWSGSISSSTPDTGPVGSLSNRVRRGGGWGSSLVYCEVSYRLSSTPDIQNLGLGFRVVRNAD